MNEQLMPGDRVRVMIYRGGRHVTNYEAVFVSYSKDDKARLLADDGKPKCVDPDQVRKIESATP